MKFLFSLFAILVLTESCGSTKESVTTDDATEQKSNMEQSTLSGTYIIEEIDSAKDFSEKLTITFDASSNAVNGFSGCNNFFGNYTTKGNTIEFGAIATSKKFCQKGKNLLERKFLSTLKKVNRYKIIDNTISFYNDDNMLLKGSVETHGKPSKGKDIGDHYNKTQITYQALSRGVFEYIQISKSEITISSDRNLKEMDSYTCSKSDWDALKTLLENIDVEKLDQLKAPTDKRLYDGAAHANLSVIKGDVEMRSSTFDHGYPPKEIEAIVNKVLSIKEKVTKQ